MGGADSTRLRDEFRPKGFSIDSLLTLGKEYNALYEEKLEQLQEREDSLAQVKVELATRGDSLIKVESALKGFSDSTRNKKLLENRANLTKFFNGIKAAPAAGRLGTAWAKMRRRRASPRWSICSNPLHPTTQWWSLWTSHAR